jgi:serine/threonine protein kinase
MAPDPARDAYIQVIEARPDIGVRYLGPRRVGLTGGDGHYSIVFKARDTQTNRDVAIKVFRPDRLVEVYRFQCFCREAIILEQLAGSPHILEWVGARGEFVERVQSSTGIPFELRFPYFVVELASSDVAAIIRAGTWDFQQKLVAFREMCKAIQRIHGQGIVHRDIKPNNFLLMTNGEVKLSDFGTARKIDGLEPAILASYAAAPGDSRYGSPEMLALLHDDDPEIAKKGDIYALGATLFELCTGTILGVQLFDTRFALALAQSMGAVQKRDRKRFYLQFLPNLDVGHPLPSVSAYASDVPACIRDIVDSLYKAMAALDYRKRLCDFERIFLKIDQCLLVLTNEEKVRRWRQQKEVYRRNRLAKLTRRQPNAVQAKGGKKS